MSRLSGTLRLLLFGALAITYVALFQTSSSENKQPRASRDDIWWKPATELPYPSEDSEEFRLSNVNCPQGLPTLEESNVAVSGLELSLFLDLPGASSVVFIGDRRGFVGTRKGQVFGFDEAKLLPRASLDLSANTSTEMDQGLLGMTISPDSDWLYINRTDSDGDSVVTAHSVDHLDLSLGSGMEIIVVDQPSAMHNGGDLAFGPDGYLYVSFGDGGGLGDPFGNGQDNLTPLGSVLRLTVEPSSWPPHAPAPGNPKLGFDSDPRIWVSGVRNPFRFSFDPFTGALWLTDLGQQCVEELNVLDASEAGVNLGWNLVEGSRPFLGEVSNSLRSPDFEYRHARGRCAIIGGLVVRNGPHPALEGRYLFSDLCGGELMMLDADNPDYVTVLDLSVSQPLGFAIDLEGLPYVVDMANGVWLLTNSS